MNAALVRQSVVQNGCRVWAPNSPKLLLSGRFKRHYSEAPVIAGVSEDEIKSARAYCSNLLQKYDAPSYTLSTFIPPQARDAYFALRAFNIEIARIGDITSNAAIGAMRMQFWRDAISRALTFTPPKEPVAVLLSYAAGDLHARTDGKNNMSKVWLHRIINTREQYLHNPPYPDMAALEGYAESTYSTLLYVTLSTLPSTSVTADHLASHIGKAQGIAAVLRGLPFLAFPTPSPHQTNQATASLGGAISSPNKQGTVTLPLDVMADAGLREEEVFRKGASAPGLRDAVFAVATRANDHLITAREMLKSINEGQGAGHEFEYKDDAEHQYRSAAPSSSSAQNQTAEVERAFGVFMPAVATQMWLDNLQKLDFDVFSPKLRAQDWKLPLKAYWAFSRRKF